MKELNIKDREEAVRQFTGMKMHLNLLRKQLKIIEKIAENEYNKDIEKVKKMAGYKEGMING